MVLTALAAAGTLLATTGGAGAQTTAAVTTLRSFNGVNGQQAEYALVAGNDGNFYGTASNGGANGYGTFFRVSPDGALTLLHSFTYATDGAYPKCTLALASDGNFYGTTQYGGPDSGGTVFRATPDGTVTVLHAFSSYTDAAQGNQPLGGVSQGRDGMLYGTTSTGGLNNDGTVYQVGLDGFFTSLYTFNFHQSGAGPYNPQFPPVQGSDGNFYGVAAGGDTANGAVYRMTPDGTLTTIHSFVKTDGTQPVGTLVDDGSGFLYGVTQGGGGASGNANGTIYKVARTGQLTTLHVFASGDVTGNYPDPGLIRGRDGNLYGTTRNGGTHYQGNIFQCTPAGAVTNLYSLNSGSSDSGYYPDGGLLQAADGSFYGLTPSGGVSNYGVVYRLTISPHPPFFDGAADLGNGAEYLAFSNGNYFGYYSYLSDPHYVYHFDLGYEYVFDAADGKAGVYLYDFKSGDFFYTSPTFPFPYLYDFALNTVLYYYPDPNNAGRYNTNGRRYFYRFDTGKIITR